MTSMHGLPKGKRKVFRKDNIIQQIILGALIIAGVIFAFLYDVPPMLKFLAGIMLAIVAVVILSYYMLEFFTGRGYVVASAINEALYLVLGIPILVIAAGFLPVSFYVAFSPGTVTDLVKIVLIVVLGIIEISAIMFLINRYLREKKMNVVQYFKYIFDFKARAKDQKKFQERADQIDHFYDDLSKVSDKLAKKREERAMGFEDFDFRERTGLLGLRKTIKIKCKNCQTINEEDSHFCTTCSAPLKKEQ
ncbi:MAG: hypothetical protein KAS47_07620 [Candidatus Heimdallarchaeota archaeon]|nr:hypothetical protein [Candidatus Heimdallarchaeota archaeon]